MSSLLRLTAFAARPVAMSIEPSDLVLCIPIANGAAAYCIANVFESMSCWLVVLISILVKPKPTLKPLMLPDVKPTLYPLALLLGAATATESLLVALFRP